MKPYTSDSGTKFKLAAAVALTAALLLSCAGCAKDEHPPVIQQSVMPEWAVENENIDLTVKTADDRGVKEVYVQFDSVDKIPLAKVDSQKNGEVIANWKASFKLSPKDYSYSIVAEDKAGNKSDPKAGKITVYSKNSLYGYARGKGIDTYLSQLVSLEKDGTVDENGKAFIDLVVKYPEAGELVPGIYAELLKLPDLSKEKYSKIDERDIKAVGKILALASDPKYTPAFLSIDSVGIKDKRAYSAEWEALLWEAFDDKNLSDFLEPYSLERLIKDAWTNTSTSRNYGHNRWSDFDEVVARLSFPEGGYWYIKNNIKFEIDLGYGKIPKELFVKKVGDCDDYSTFITHCLLMNGYDLDKFEKTPETVYPPNDKSEIHETNAVCTLLIYMGISGAYGHAVAVVEDKNQLFVFDATPFEKKNIGPFKNSTDLLDTLLPGWTVAVMCDDQPLRVIGVIRSKDYQRSLQNKDFRNEVKNVLKSSPFFKKEVAEHNKWMIENLDSYDK